VDLAAPDTIAPMAAADLGSMINKQVAWEKNMKRHRLSTTLVAGLAAVALVAAIGQTLLPAHGQQAQQAQQPPPYRPGMGDLMAGSVQPRHLKLAAAAQAQDWAYAGYTLHELGESFDRVVRTFPMIRQMPAADLVDKATKTPMAALDAAIKAADIGAFNKAYAQLTDGCNGCHIQTGREMIVIKVPGAVTSFPDQELKPTKP
jgi:hypothetical protein